jgi:hypothetical protein
MNAYILCLALSAESIAQPPPIPDPLLAPSTPPAGAILLPAAPPPVKPPTLKQFVATFVPRPGVHEVTVIHPWTNKPICFDFRLPDCPIKKVRRGLTRVTFDYDRTKVTLIFRIGGKVDVRYD